VREISKEKAKGKLNFFLNFLPAKKCRKVLLLVPKINKLVFLAFKKFFVINAGYVFGVVLNSWNAFWGFHR